MRYLKHHGIQGQKWGKRNGPPYPLDSEDHSKAEQKAGWRRSLRRNSTTTGGIQNRGSIEKGHTGLTDGQKKAITVGAALAVTALAAYGGYQLYKSGALNGLIEKGKRLRSQSIAPGPPKPNRINEALEHGYSKLSSEETFSEAAKAVNPYEGDGRKFNCWSCGIAGYLRSNGVQVKARASETGLKNLKERYSSIIKDIDSHTIEGSASQLGGNKDNAEKLILSRFKDDGAEGVIDVSWTNNRGGHVFNWKIEGGRVKFFDYQSGRHSDSFNWNAYFSQVDGNKYFFCTRLDDAEFDWDNIQKFIRK